MKVSILNYIFELFKILCHKKMYVHVKYIYYYLNIDY